MAIQNGNIIKSPVHLAANVARVLRANLLTAAALCTHPNINKWAKYKPFRCSTIAFTQDANNDYMNENGDRNIALKAANYGLKEPQQYTSVEYTKNDTEAWSYLKPTGGISSPYRISDFLNYNHAARYPYVFKGDITVSILFDTAVYMYGLNIIDESGLTIPFNSLLEGYYIAVYLTWEYNGRSYSAYETISEQDGKVTLSDLMSNIGNNEFDYYLVLTDMQKKFSDPTPYAHFFVMPYENSINELSGKLKISTSNPLRQKMTGIAPAFATWLTIPDDYIGVVPIEPDDSYFFPIKNYTLYVEYEFTNNSDSTRTIYSNRLSVRSNDRNFAGAIVSSYNNVSMYDVNSKNDKETISSINIAPHSSSKVRFLIPNLVFAGNSTGNLPDTSRFENKRLTMTLMFYIMTGNQRYSFFSEMIRLRNY